MDTFLTQISGPVRILVLIVIVAMSHLAVIVVRRINKRVMGLSPRASLSKVRSISSLSASIIVFLLYFGVLGFILKEFGVSLTAYLASASVMGLAIGFGSQGLVQDVVTGLTLIFSDLLDLGDVVEISGQTGIVRQIGMRFIVLENHLGAEVSIPNRTVTSGRNCPKNSRK